ncbi:glycerate kinase, partial [Streptomyces sp. SM14]|uniref:glycerate kinase n=1 Tax=Streptomyces sp. SM14 TaxID=1736045 RepID=UPI0011B00CBF
AARAAGRRVVAVCGRLDIDEAALRGAGIERAYPLTSMEPDPAVCVAQAGPLLERLARRVATDLL